MAECEWQLVVTQLGVRHSTSDTYSAASAGELHVDLMIISALVGSRQQR